MIALSLFIEMLGYHVFERLTWIDSFPNAFMLLWGMGPIELPRSYGGKLYALCCGLDVILVAGVTLAPSIHRLFYTFHMEGPQR